MTNQPRPTVVTSMVEARGLVHQCRAANKRLGLVPTMGALHDGHLRLVRECTTSCEACAVSIFVNPTQFGPGEDFERYPRNLEHDLDLLAAHQVDWVFAPWDGEMYRKGHSTMVQPPKVASRFEGECRPGHFEGVCTIVLKLFHAIPAQVAYFGQKDYQQWLVIRNMVRDLNLDLEIARIATVRDEDGLALSSRNRYLSEDERRSALGISQALRGVADRVLSGESQVASLTAGMQRTMRDAGITHVDYAAIVDAESLDDLDELDRPAVALIAARVGATRLIDNQLLHPGR